MSRKPSQQYPFRILVVENETTSFHALTTSLSHLGYTAVGEASCYEEAKSLLDSTFIDLMLIDVTLNKSEDGIRLAEKLKAEYNLPFIYVSSSFDRQTIEKAKHSCPSTYLLRPFGENALYGAIEIAMFNYYSESTTLSNFNETQAILLMDGIFLKAKSSFVKLRYDDIKYLKSEGNYIHVFGDCCKHIIRSTQSEILKILGQSKFIKANRSYLVNISKISAIYPTELSIGDTKIPLQKENRQRLLDRIATLG